MTGNNANGTFKPGKTREAPKGRSAMDEFWFSDRTARRYGDRLQKAQKRRKPKNTNGFG
jgi:hypothetical protein|tara:strand:+ start:278 stop:454 length:177 start_codon:yes stop_codon:yes gene_type:complete